MKVYASISGGKDSLAALITHMERGGQCDGAIYCRIMLDDETSAEVPEHEEQMHTDIEKVHKEMWSAVKDRNEDAFAALSQEFERSSRILAEEWAQTSALAKIAVISESND